MAVQFANAELLMIYAKLVLLEADFPSNTRLLFNIFGKISQFMCVQEGDFIQYTNFEEVILTHFQELGTCPEGTRCEVPTCFGELCASVKAECIPGVHCIAPLFISKVVF